jgi:hypothetical protein
MLWVVNNAFVPRHDLMVQAKTFDIAGKDSLIFQWIVEISPSTAQRIDTITSTLRRAFAREGGFLSLRLLDVSRTVLSQNVYWYPDSSQTYSGLQRMAQAAITANARRVSEGTIEVSIQNPAGGPLAFFLRIALVNGESKKRILPVFYRDNFVTVLPGEKQTYTIEHSPGVNSAGAMVSISGWNVSERYIAIE